jgi:lipopolysaccharide/colanic/teichoic acid biosynthesis glycosyltransferase
MNTRTLSKTEGRSTLSKRPFYRAAKRVFDVVVASLLIILSSPVLLIVSILIIADDGFPVLFKQKRTGLQGKVFSIYKFRSMKTGKGSPKGKSEYNWVGGVPDDFLFKTTDSFNPNVTKIGRFIRKYSLDELPQFFNVIKGDMSMVGPRPELTDITDCYNSHQWQRVNVKPGITGWAQVNGRSEIPHGQKIEYDLYYVENQSFLLDLKIFFVTIYQSLFGKGAI